MFHFLLLLETLPEIYVEPEPEKKKYLNSDWTLWSHKNDNKNWKAESYEYGKMADED